MKVGFIGAGKVGFSLSRYFVAHHVEVTGFYSRSPESAKAAADFTNTKSYNSIESILGDSDTLFLTVPDGQISEVWDCMKNLDIKNKTICHCSGLISSTTFFDAKERGARVCSVHPLYAINDKFLSWHKLGEAIFTIEGDSDGQSSLLEALSSCGNRVISLDAAKKPLYHCSAVMISNLVCGLFHTAMTMLQQCGFSAQEAAQGLTPLFMGNAQSIAEMGAAKALTGPIERGDIETVRWHFSALEEGKKTEDCRENAIYEIYRLLSMEVLKLAESKHPQRDYKELKEVLCNEKHRNVI